jgi:hypothetical protein
LTALPRIAGLVDHTDNEFRAELVATARRLKIEPAWLAACIAFETAKSWAPDVLSGGGRYRGPQDNGKAVGLIQFTGVSIAAMARRGWVTSKEELAALSAVQQLEWVERHFVTVGAVGRMRSVSDVYMAIFAPAGIGKPDGFALYAAPSSAYTANKGLDRNGDGTITRGEACAAVKALLAQGIAAGSVEVQEDSGGVDGAAVVAFPGLAGVGDELSALRESVDSLHASICGRLDTLNESLRALTTVHR